MPAGATTLTATTTGGTARLDAVMVQPLVSRLVLGGDGHGTALLRSAATSTSRTTVTVPGTGHGRRSGRTTAGPSARPHHQHASGVPVTVAPGGVTIVRR